MTAVQNKPRKRAASPRKATPRKAASNGSGGAILVDEGWRSPDMPPTDVRPVEEIKPPETPVHPIYGTRRVYSYQPKDGSPLIEFPHISGVPVDPKFFWRIYPLNEMFQSFEWMNQANVPRDIQERVMDLPDGEKGNFFKGWFADINAPQGVAPPGES